MTKVYNDFSEVCDNFDSLLVDAYGVFWDGGKFYEGSLEILSDMVNKGKKVCILSNTTGTSEDSIKSYDKKGMKHGVHYTDFVTSGDVARKAVIDQSLDITEGSIYMWGTPNKKLFADSKYNVTNDINEAKSFYISIPQLTFEQKAKFKELEHEFYSSRLPKEGEPDLWDSMVVDPFLPSLKELFARGLTAINANPDFRAFETPKGGSVGKPVIRQGLIAQIYKDMGGKVIEFGKPHANAYSYAFEVSGIVPSKRVAMIGDTYRTDIKGGLDAGISSVWCVSTGMTKYDREMGKTIEDLCGNNFDNIYLIKGLGKAEYK